MDGLTFAVRCYIILLVRLMCKGVCMAGKLATTKMSSKGQVVIPEDIRNQLGLESGVQFVVVGKGDAIILKVISAPAFGQFSPLIEEARRQAKRAKLKKTDLKDAIKRARKRS